MANRAKNLSKIDGKAFLQSAFASEQRLAQAKLQSSERISHNGDMGEVEPRNDPQTGNFIDFTVDLTPVGGPIKEGFSDYQAAVDWEVEWLNQNNIPTSHNPIPKN